MLRADAAKENTNVQFFHVIASFFGKNLDSRIFYNFHLEIRIFDAIIGENPFQGGSPCRSI
jgi:hypothetical protein